MLVDYLNVLVPYKAQEIDIPTENHLIAGIRFFLKRYPEALFKLNSLTASYIVKLESGKCRQAEGENGRVYFNVNFSTSSSDAIIEHLGNLQVHKHANMMWFKAKPHHASVLYYAGRNQINVDDALCIHGSTEDGFRLIYDLEEARNLDVYYGRSLKVLVPSALPHPRQRPRRQERVTNQVRIHWETA